MIKPGDLVVWVDETSVLRYNNIGLVTKTIAEAAEEALVYWISKNGMHSYAYEFTLNLHVIKP